MEVCQLLHDQEEVVQRQDLHLVHHLGGAGHSGHAHLHDGTKETNRTDEYFQATFSLLYQEDVLNALPTC